HRPPPLTAPAPPIAAVAFAEQFAALKKDDEPRVKDEALDQEMATLRAVGRALVTPRAEGDEAGEAAAALGLWPGLPGSNDPRVVAALYRRVRGNPTLRRIC